MCIPVLYHLCLAQGYGESKAAGAVQDKAEYLRSFLAQLSVSSPILVSPSMSGGFSIPFLVQHPEALAGYVPVAPVGTERGKAKYPELQVRGEGVTLYTSSGSLVEAVADMSFSIILHTVIHGTFFSLSSSPFTISYFLHLFPVPHSPPVFLLLFTSLPYLPKHIC